MRPLVLRAAALAAVLAGCRAGPQGAAVPQPPTTTTVAATTPSTGPRPPATTAPAARPTTTTTGFAALMRAPLTEVFDFPGPPDKGQVGLAPDKAQGRVCYDFELRETDEPTETHVHEGPVRAPSPVVLTLHPLVGRPGQTRGGPTDGRGGYVGAQGCEPADGSLIDGLLADPAGYYVEVHTAQAPAGAARGRLAR